MHTMIFCNGDNKKFVLKSGGRIEVGSIHGIDLKQPYGVVIAAYQGDFVWHQVAPEDVPDSIGIQSEKKTPGEPITTWFAIVFLIVFIIAWGFNFAGNNNREPDERVLAAAASAGFREPDYKVGNSQALGLFGNNGCDRMDGRKYSIVKRGKEVAFVCSGSQLPWMERKGSTVRF